MESDETKMKFVELRARGVSVQKISAELAVAPATLYRWHDAMKEEIDKRRFAERERIMEKFNLAENERIEQLCAIYRRASEQVTKDSFHIIPTTQLVKMMLALDKKFLKAIEMPADGHADTVENKEIENDSGIKP
jgi:hypothetical protein